MAELSGLLNQYPQQLCHVRLIFDDQHACAPRGGNYGPNTVENILDGSEAYPGNSRDLARFKPANRRKQQASSLIKGQPPQRFQCRSAIAHRLQVVQQSRIDRLEQILSAYFLALGRLVIVNEVLQHMTDDFVPSDCVLNEQMRIRA